MKPLPPRPPWHKRLYWLAWSWARWPVDVRQLKREGWVRTGWCRWESPHN